MNTIEHRFSLDKSSKKYGCPGCEKRTFTRYVDTITGEVLNTNVGRCDREESCAYHYTPREYFADNLYQPAQMPGNPKPYRTQPKPKAGRLPQVMAQATLDRYDSNQLIRWLATLPGWNVQRAEQTARLYRVGTGRDKTPVEGWPIFWQIDQLDQVRSGKLIRYDPDTGKREKGEGININWIHSMLQRANQLPTDISQWSLDQCLFGLHLVNTDKTKPIAIVEGEKTALICSQYLPGMIWLSTGQKNGLNRDKLRPIAGRKIVLFPDKGKAFDAWNHKAGEFKNEFNIHVSTLLEREVPNQHEGYDLADYLIRYDINTFTVSAPDPYPYGVNPYTGEIFDERGYPADWDDIAPPGEGSAEYREMLLLIQREFDAVIDTTFDPDGVQPEPLSVDSWRKRTG